MYTARDGREYTRILKAARGPMWDMSKDDLIFLRSRSSATHFIRCTDQEGQEVYVRVSDIVSARYRRCDE